jgi:hypothetical protein
MQCNAMHDGLSVHALASCITPFALPAQITMLLEQSDMQLESFVFFEGLEDVCGTILFCNRL